jgi:hypothetical protein
MPKCKCCGRELQKNENEYCPSCASTKSHKIKKIIEIATPVVIAIAGYTYKFLKKNKN